MKKETLMKILLVLLPILAVGLATTRDSVMLFDPETGVATYCSYFTPLEAGPFQMITPLAAILSGVTGILGAIYAASRKQGVLKAVVGTAFASATLAGLPIMLSTDVKIIPNVGLPIFMVIELFLAYYILKKPQQEAEKVSKIQRRR